MTSADSQALSSADPGAAPDAPANPGRARLWRRTAGAAAIVAVLVVGNATQAQAAPRSNGSTAAPTNSSAGVGEVAGSALHGEFLVLNRDGSAQLRRWQSGEVDAIDNLALTVRSADGFNGRYLLGPGVSVTGIGIGDEVTVVGAGQAIPAEARAFRRQPARLDDRKREGKVACRRTNPSRSPCVMGPPVTARAAPRGRPASPLLLSQHPRPAHPEPPRPSARRWQGWCGTRQNAPRALRTAPLTGW